MPTRTEIVTCARKWIGTKYRHEGRLRGVACDCAGLILEVARELNLTDASIQGYGRIPGDVEAYCDRYMIRLTTNEVVRPGDVYLLRLSQSGEPRHLAFASDIGMIHSWAAARRVCEHRIDSEWAGCIVRTYKIPGVED